MNRAARRAAARREAEAAPPPRPWTEPGPDAEPVELTAYATGEGLPEIVPAPPGREWIDKTGDRHIYRCLPVAVGMCYGWQILCPADLAVAWNGGETVGDLAVACERPYTASSNFAHGIVTMEVGYVFQTSPGAHLLVTGPFNHPKHGASGLTGVIETDWCPYSFTLNFRLTAPGIVEWKAGEPIGQIVPVVAGFPSRVRAPAIRRLADNPDLEREHLAWRADRERNRAAMAAGDPEALKVPWVKHYTVGRYATDRRPTERPHASKLRLPPFADLRSAPVSS